jgi:hypothetical protein
MTDAFNHNSGFTMKFDLIDLPDVIDAISLHAGTCLAMSDAAGKDAMKKLKAQLLVSAPELVHHFEPKTWRTMLTAARVATSCVVDIERYQAKGMAYSRNGYDLVVTINGRKFTADAWDAPRRDRFEGYPREAAQHLAGQMVYLIQAETLVDTKVEKGAGLASPDGTPTP